MKYTIESSTLEGIADSIREVTKTEASIRPEEMATKIGEIGPETLLPELSNPASAENVQEGYEVIDEEGNVIIGTHVEATLVDLLPNLSNPAGATQILSGYDTVNDNGEVVTGTMANNGAVSQALNCGGSYTIPAGYHNGSGKVTANSLASQTAGTAAAADIASGKTAWVGGTKLTGTGAKCVSGTTVIRAGGTLTLPFEPKFVFIMLKSGYTNVGGRINYGWYSTDDVVSKCYCKASDAGTSTGFTISGKVITFSTKSTGNCTWGNPNTNYTYFYYALA